MDMTNNKKKYFVCSDIHGFYDLFLQELSNKGFDINNENHIIICCGDLFDRGPDPVKLFDFVKSLGSRFIYIKGNHEYLLEDCLDEMTRGYIPSDHHWDNGTVDTIFKFSDFNRGTYSELYYSAREILYDANKEYAGVRINSDKFNIFEEKVRPVIDFINEKAIDCYELKDYIFVHGWIPQKEDTDYECEYDEEWRNASKERFKEATWMNGMYYWKQGLREPNKTIICGHFHCSYGNSHYHMNCKEFPEKNTPNFAKSFEPFIDNGIVAIDACTAYSNIVNIYVIEE